MKNRKHNATGIFWLILLATLLLASKYQEYKQPLLSPYAGEVQAYEPSRDLKRERQERLYRVVLELESNNGQAPAGHHRDCEKLGKVNQIGYRALQEYCFNSIHEQIKSFMAWTSKQIDAGYTDSQLLCYYNQGKRLNVCQYSKDAGLLLVTKLSK